MGPTPPIFIVDRESGDIVWAFSDARTAQGVMEPPEVNAGAYLVFDGAGHVGALNVQGHDVVIDSWSREPSTVEFRPILNAYVGARRDVAEDATLDDLVLAAYELAREEELARTHPRFLIPLMRWITRRPKNPRAD